MNEILKIVLWGKKQGDEPENDVSYSLNLRNEKCNACGGSECENKGSKGFEYIKCKEFRQTSHRERLRKLIKDKICFQCLQPNHGTKSICQRNEFMCKNEFHKRLSKGYQDLVCQAHQDESCNKMLVEDYMLKVFRSKSNILKSYVAVTPVYKIGRNHEKKPVGVDSNDETAESAVYMFQQIVLDGRKWQFVL